MRIVIATALTFFLMSLTLASCNDGGEDDLLRFQSSPCKKETVAGSRSLSLYTRQTEAGLQGLKCLSWKTTGAETMSFDLLNFEGACGAEWQGRADVDGENAVTLGAVNPDCLIASCGWCIYDWSFSVESLAPSKDLNVTIVEDTCPGEEPPETTTAALPKASLSEGMICRYAFYFALEWHAGATGESGLLHMPCATSDSGEETELKPCAEGMVCERQLDDPAQRVCLAVCQVDADCPLPELLTCQAGLCRLASPWR